MTTKLTFLSSWNELFSFNPHNSRKIKYKESQFLGMCGLWLQVLVGSPTLRHLVKCGHQFVFTVWPKLPLESQHGQGDSHANVRPACITKWWQRRSTEFAFSGPTLKTESEPDMYILCIFAVGLAAIRLMPPVHWSHSLLTSPRW